VARRPAFLVALTLIVATQAGCDYFVSADKRVRQGQASLARADYPAASIQFKSALQKAPDNLDARIGLAESSLALGDPAAAQKEIERAVALKAPAARVELLRWRAAIALGRFDEVATALAKPRVGLEDEQRNLLRAEALARLGRTGESGELYRQLIAGPKVSADALTGYGKLLAGIGKYDEALKELDAALAARPGDAEALVLRAETLRRSGRIAEADKAYSDARAHVDARRNLRLYVATLVGMANNSLALGHVDAARAALKDLTVAAPRSLVTQLLNARLALADHQTAAALDTLRAVTSADPANSEALYLLGVAQLESGQFAQAETSLGQVARQRPRDGVVRKLLADVQLRQGRVDAARATLDATPADEIDSGTLILRSHVASASGDRDGALKELQRAEQLDPKNSAVKFELARAYVADGKSSQALGVLDQLPDAQQGAYRTEMLRLYALPEDKRVDEVHRFVAGHESDAGAHLLAGTYFRSAGQTDTAREQLAAALKIAPKDPRVLEAISQLEFSTGHLDAADAALKLLVEVAPDAIRPRIARAEIAARRGDEPRAIALLEEARAHDARAVEPRILLARNAAATGHIDAARTLIQEALAIDSRRFDVLSAAAFIEQQAGDLAKGLAFLDKATTANPTSADAWYAKSQYQVALGQGAEAIASLNAALAARPDWPPAAGALAGQLVKAGKPDEARQVAERLKARQATRFDGFVLAGDLEGTRGRFPAAIEEYNQALAIHPIGGVVIRRYTAQVRGHLPGAVEGLESWLKDHPADEDVHFVHAGALEARGANADAAREYEQIVAAAPRSAPALNNLALVYQRLGDPRALETARKAYGLAPKQPSIIDTLAWLLISGTDPNQGVSLLAPLAQATGDPNVRYHYAAGLAKIGKKADSAQVLKKILSTPGPFESRSAAEALAKELT
jgi:putative PEP-CTERM system TPR-repeat lipoprotein